MIARLAEHHLLPADLDPDPVTRHRAWMAAQPGFCGGYDLLDPESEHALSLTLWRTRRRWPPPTAPRATGRPTGRFLGLLGQRALQIGGRAAPDRPPSAAAARAPAPGGAPAPSASRPARRSADRRSAASRCWLVSYWLAILSISSLNKSARSSAIEPAPPPPPPPPALRCVCTCSSYSSSACCRYCSALFSGGSACRRSAPAACLPRSSSRRPPAAAARRSS